MRNIVTFDVRGECNCVFVSNVFDWSSENIILTFEADSYTSPKIEVEFGVGGNIETHDLTVENGLAIYDFPLTNFDKSPFIYIRYLDGEKVGTWFRFNCTQGGTIPNNHTCKVLKNGETIFNVYYVVIYNISSNMTYNKDDFIIKNITTTTDTETTETAGDTSELSIKDVKSIIVQTTTAGTITDVGFVYEDNTGKNYEVAFNADGKLAKFGDITFTCICAIRT